MAEWKIRHENCQIVRFPWSRLKNDTAAFIEPGCLPPGFQLQDPENLKTAEVAELWKHIYRRQQSGRVLGLKFTDKVTELLKKRGKDSSRHAIKTSDRDHAIPQLANNIKGLIPLKSEDDVPVNTRHPAIDSGTVSSERNVESTIKKEMLANETGSVIPITMDRTHSCSESTSRYAPLPSSPSCSLLTLETEMSHVRRVRIYGRQMGKRLIWIQAIARRPVWRILIYRLPESGTPNRFCVVGSLPWFFL